MKLHLHSEDDETDSTISVHSCDKIILNKLIENCDDSENYKSSSDIDEKEYGGSQVDPPLSVREEENFKDILMKVNFLFLSFLKLS